MEAASGFLNVSLRVVSPSVRGKQLSALPVDSWIDWSPWPELLGSQARLTEASGLDLARVTRRESIIVMLYSRHALLWLSQAIWLL